MSLLDFMPLHVTCSISFSSTFYHARAGSRYTEDVLCDPIKRHEQEVREWKYRITTYPEIFANKEKTPPKPRLGIGVPTNPKIFGCRVLFREHMDAHALPLIGPGEDPMRLKLPNVQDNMQWLYDEIDTLIDAGWKRNELALPDLQGPLNQLFRVVGDNRMLSLIARPSKAPVVHHLLGLATELYCEVYESLRKATGRPVKGGFTASGCTYYYLSPRHFEEFILPVLNACRERLGEPVGLHHCGKANTAQVEAYASFPFQHVTLGFGSDLRRARELMIHPTVGPIPFSCRISPFRMLNQPASQIASDVEWILERVRGGPASIHLVGCPNGVPEDNIWSLWNAVKEYNRRKAMEEGEDFTGGDDQVM